MAKDIWVISDTHFGHPNIIRYCNRPFSSAWEMNETIRTNWNSVVKDGDRVYHLGDVYFGGGFKSTDEITAFLNSLKGSKRLILGNHDEGKDQILQRWAKKISMWRMFPELNLLLTHVPVHESTLTNSKRQLINVHGHIHQNKSPSKFHKNVSVEWTNYSPIHIEELRKEYG